MRNASRMRAGTGSLMTISSTRSSALPFSRKVDVDQVLALLAEAARAVAAEGLPPSFE
jgi:hypothetical protein